MAVARDASVMPDHLDGGEHTSREGKNLPCEVVDYRFGWFDELVAHDDAGLVIDDAYAG